MASPNKRLKVSEFVLSQAEEDSEVLSDISAPVILSNSSSEAFAACCEVCGGFKDEALLLLCDRCEAAYHTFCLLPPLSLVPQGDWKCKSCLQNASTPKRPLSAKRKPQNEEEYIADRRTSDDEFIARESEVDQCLSVGSIETENESFSSEKDSEEPGLNPQKLEPKELCNDGIYREAKMTSKSIEKWTRVVMEQTQGSPCKGLSRRSALTLPWWQLKDGQKSLISEVEKRDQTKRFSSFRKKLLSGHLDDIVKCLAKGVPIVGTNLLDSLIQWLSLKKRQMAQARPELFYPAVEKFESLWDVRSAKRLLLLAENGDKKSSRTLKRLNKLYKKCFKKNFGEPFTEDTFLSSVLSFVRGFGSLSHSEGFLLCLHCFLEEITALWFVSCKKGHFVKALELILLGFNPKTSRPDLLSFESGEGFGESHTFSGIFEAVRGSNKELVCMLLDSGVEPNYKIEERFVLELAVNLNQKAIVKKLLDCGANPNILVKSTCLDIIGESVPLVFEAILGNKIKILKLLILSGALVREKRYLSKFAESGSKVTLEKLSKRFGLKRKVKIWRKKYKKRIAKKKRFIDTHLKCELSSMFPARVLVSIMRFCFGE